MHVDAPMVAGIVTGEGGQGSGRMAKGLTGLERGKGVTKLSTICNGVYRTIYGNRRFDI